MSHFPGETHPTLRAAGQALERLAAIMAKLRSPGGCPWDREQDHRSLRPYVIEEAFEVAEAIDAGSSPGLREELGDLLLQVVFHARVAEEAGTFDLAQVIDGISDKMIRRHPHVFGTATARTSEEVLARWEEIKRTEKEMVSEEAAATTTATESADKDGGDGLLEGVPPGLPALLVAQKVYGRARRGKSETAKAPDPFAEAQQTLAELASAYNRRDTATIEAKIGALLWAVAALAHDAGVDAEGALARTTRAFATAREGVPALKRREGSV